MTLRLVVFCLSVLVGFPAAAQWDDEPKRTRTRGGTERVGPPPTGIMAIVEEHGDDWEEPRKKRPEPGERTRREEPANAREETRPWTDAPPPRGLVVIDEETSVSNVVIHGVPDPDRVGRSLGASNSKGLSLGATRYDGEKSYRVRADKLDEAEAAERAKNEAIERKKMKAPMGIMVPVERDFDDEAHAGDPWARERRPAVQRKAGSTHRSLLDELSESTSQTFDASEYTAPAQEPDLRRESGSFSDSIWSDTVGDVVRPDDSERATFHSGDESRALSPAPQPAAVPAPARMRRPAAAVSPEPERDKSKRATSSDRSVENPVKELEKKPEKILSYDPFAKLEGDLAEAEGRERPDPQSLPEYEVEKPTVEKLRAPRYDEPEMAVAPIAPPKEKSRTRDPSYWGLSALAGVGVNVANEPVDGYTADFAWGLNLRLQPLFTGPIALDLSFWRAARADGTPVVNVESAWSHVGIRAFFVRDFEKGMFMGFGGGLLLTNSSVSYTVNDAGEDTASGSLLRPGGDLSAIMGFRYKLFEMRLDLRTMLRGGMRLDFLPVLSFGISI